MHMGDILRLEGFGVGIGERTILGAIDLNVPDKGVTSVFGPSGTGKSTLLRTLSGLNDASPNLRIWGHASYAGETLGVGDRPVMMVQSARLLAANVLRNLLHDIPERHTLDIAQQRELALNLLEEWGVGELKEKLYEPASHLSLYLNRCLSIMRICAPNPRMICLDEPTAGLDEQGVCKVLELIRLQTEKRAVLVTLHNQAHATYLGGKTVLTAGGYIQEAGESQEFFQAPQTDVGVRFAKTGSCSLPSPDAEPEMLDPEGPKPVPLPTEASNYVSDSFGPRGFVWIKKGVLAGTPQPGVFFDEAYDVKALKRVEISHLITLTEPPPKELGVDQVLLHEHGIGHSRFPVPDMEAPSMDQAYRICKRIDQLLQEGEKVAVHCRAGMGRTGTVLCSYLIWEGDDAIGALDRARSIEPRWVQSQAQVTFLEAFEQDLGQTQNRVARNGR